jgi:hypothetical protein
MMDNSYHGYEYVLEDLPWDAAEAEELYGLERPIHLAQNNVKQWIRDIETGPVFGFSGLQMTQNVEEPSRGDRYRFNVNGFFSPKEWPWPKRIPISCEVWMPGLPIRKVRCVDPKANPWQHVKIIYNDRPTKWMDSLSDFLHDCEDKVRPE